MADGEPRGLETVASGATLAVGGRVVKLVLALGLHLVMARLLGTTGYGGVVLAQVVAGLGSLIGSFGLPKGLTRQVPRFEDDVRSGRGVVRAGLALGLIGGGIVGVGVAIAAPNLAILAFGDRTLTPLLRLAGAAIPVAVLTNVGVAIARGSRDARAHVVVRQLLDPVVQLTLVGSAIALGYGAIGAMGATVLAGGISAAVALILAVRALPYPLRGPAASMHRPLIGFSLPLLLATGMDFVVIHTDTLLLGVFLTADEVGIYNVMFQLRSVGLFFFYPVTFLLPPVLTRLQTQGDWDEARETYRITTKWLVLATTPVFLLLVLFPEPLIAVTFGTAYVGGATALQILAVPVLVTALLSANGAALVALGHNRSNLYVNGAAAAANVVLNLVLIPRFGIVGAAAASATAYVGRDVVYTVLLYRWRGLQPFSAAMLRPFLGTVAIAAAGYGVFVTLVTVRPVTIAIAGPIFLVVYVLALVALGAVEPADERLLTLLEERLGVRLGVLRRLARRLARDGHV